MAKQTLNWILFVALAVLSVSCDQGAKTWARRALDGKPPVTVIDGFWDFRYAENPGGAFSLFRALPAGRVVLTAVGVVMLIALGFVVRRSAKGRAPTCVALGLVAGGALGNLYDRVVYGRVTDFVHWHVHAHEWPVFNVADAALLCGALGLVLVHRRAPSTA
jgi:signal peptidase II